MITFKLPFSELYHHTPLVFAHRGASYDAPANTLAAFRAARQMGADGIELDTSLTADGVPVVIHDLTVDETTDGTGRVRDMSLREIKRLDAGSYYDFAYKNERIPTLEEALDVIGADMLINIELKALGMRTGGLEATVMSVIRRSGAMQRVIISSFNPFALRRMGRLAPQLPLGYLYAADTPAYIRLLMLAVPHQARHPQHTLINAAYMASAHRQHYRVNAWTVDDPLRMTTLRDLSVDGIITNRPDILLQVLGRSSARTRAL